MKRWVRALVAVGLMVAACSPLGQTRYRLEAPPNPSPQTRQCLADCAVARDRCLAPAEGRLRSCEDRSTLRLQSCEQQSQLDYLVCSGAADRDGATCRRRNCGRASCSTVELDACEADHRRCFAACGGSVVEEQP